MQVLGILVRPRHDEFSDLLFRFSEEIIETARERGHIFIDLAAEMATCHNLARIMYGLGSPAGQLLKLVVFYCHGNRRSPIDQNGDDFIPEDGLSAYSGWGVFCIGCDVGQTLGHRLLTAGGHFLIAYDSAVPFLQSNPSDVFDGLNSGLVRVLREGIEPSIAMEHMRQMFVESIVRLKNKSSIDRMRRMVLRMHLHSLSYAGPDTCNELMTIRPGREQAADYQRLVARTLHNLLAPHLDEPHVEVSNNSGSSRYDIVFMNRATHGFWHDIKTTRGNALVIFDTKNKVQLEPADADQLLRYSSPWRGKVVFIVCRALPSDSFTTRASDLLKEHGVCLIVVSDTHLLEMHVLQAQGKSPTSVLEGLYRERIERA